MQEIVTLACEKWAAGDKVGQWKYEQCLVFTTLVGTGELNV